VLPVTDRFPIRKEERDAAEAVAGFAKLRDKLKRKLKPSQIVQTLRSVPEPALRILAVLESRAVSASIRAFLDSYSTVRIAATGADLRAAGLRPGPVYGEILDKLLFARLDGKIRTVADEHALLRRLAARQKDA
jgi:tRNA nucleotidyltransferase (CCA-adding enzyme)